MLNLTPDAGIDSIFETTSQMDVQIPSVVAPLTLFAPTLSPSTIATISTVPQAPTTPTTAPSTLLQDLPNLAPQAKNEEFLKILDENIQKIIKEQVKERVKVQVPKILTKIEKTILIDKMLGNKSIHRSDEQSNLYKALVKAYESDKNILDTYGDVVMLKRRHDDDADKDEEPSAGSDWGSKRRREGKEPESTSAPKEKPTRTTGKSTQGSKSQQKTASESAPVDEPMWTTHDLEEPSHQKSIQPWKSELAKQADSRSSFNELMATPVDFLAFLMNQLKVDNLTPGLLAGPTYELMKRSCKSLVELEFFLEEVYKSTTDQLDWNNPEGQQYPHNLLKPLPLIPNSRGRRVIPFDHFINNDLEYLCGGAYSRKYTTSVTKTKATYYGHIKWIEDLVPCIMWSQEPNKDKQNRLIRIDELHKFGDGTLNDVRNALDDRLKGIRMKYLP
uniref:Uncharacterized protein n=1 Tax=Tanacetum cinerariifolium TaxID=118510 RepID=A0A699IE90_TANCI|nr:hypothetical protein [Tanacetum cinerariifolium]